MEKYISQLIEDFRQIRQKTRLPDHPSITPYVVIDHEKIEDDEDYPSGPPRPLSEILGIPQENLPSPELLEKHEFDILVPEIILLLNHFNFYPEFPEGVPNELKYYHLREAWVKSYIFVEAGYSYIYFCDQDIENCPFEEYCRDCLDFIDDELYDEFFDDLEDEFDDEFDDAFDEDIEEENDLSSPDKDDDTFKDIDIDGLLPSKEQAEEFYRLNRKEDIKSLLKKPVSESHIPGIHNYCDRWCERCSFTSRCSNFSIHQELYNNRVYHDMDNESFWRELSIMMEAYGELIKESAQKFDIDIVEVEMEENGSEDPLKHPLSKIAQEYSRKSIEWMKTVNRNGNNRSSESRIQIDEAFKVIEWYNVFIPAKLSRAIHSLNDAENETSDYDMNGSAKVALVAIDRSISSFCLLFKEYSQNQDEVIGFLSYLSKIKEETEKLFPKAWEFVRPGLDE